MHWLRVTVTAAIFASATVVASARDRGQFATSSPEMKLWFDSLRSERGPCCSDADGAVVPDVDWETKDGRFRVRLEGAWVEVPDGAVILEPNRAHRTMIWPIYLDHEIYIRCFMPGNMT